MTFTRLNSTHTHTHSLVRFLLSIAWLTKLPELPHLRSLHTARAHTHTESTSESFIRFLYTLPCGRSSASSMLSAVLSRWFVCFMTSLFYSSHARGATVKYFSPDLCRLPLLSPKHRFYKWGFFHDASGPSATCFNYQHKKTTN